MAIYNQSAFLSVDPVKRKFFELGRDSAETQCWKFVKKGTMEDAVRHAVRYGNAGQMAVKSEGAAVSEGTFYQGQDKTWNAVTYAGGYTLSGEVIQDSKLKLIKTPAALLGRKAEIHPDQLWAIFLGQAFNSSYPVTDDNICACSAAHLLADQVTTGSNLLSTAAALEEESLEQMLTTMRQTIADDGTRQRVQAKNIVVGSTLVPIANKLYSTPKQVGTMNNDDSWVKGQVEVAPFDTLVSQTNWFVTGKAPYANGADGLFFDYRMPVTFMTDDVPRMWTKFYMALYRAAFGLEEWRLLWGSNVV
jgi:hypothetical protein